MVSLSDCCRSCDEVLRQLSRNQRAEVQVLAGEEDFRSAAHHEQSLPGQTHKINRLLHPD